MVFICKVIIVKTQVRRGSFFRNIKRFLNNTVLDTFDLSLKVRFSDRFNRVYVVPVACPSNKDA